MTDRKFPLLGDITEGRADSVNRKPISARPAVPRAQVAAPLKEQPVPVLQSQAAAPQQKKPGG